MNKTYLIQKAYHRKFPWPNSTPSYVWPSPLSRRRVRFNVNSYQR
jgi:hypothetical protein